MMIRVKEVIIIRMDGASVNTVSANSTCRQLRLQPIFRLEHFFLCWEIVRNERDRAFAAEGQNTSTLNDSVFVGNISFIVDLPIDIFAVTAPSTLHYLLIGAAIVLSIYSLKSTLWTLNVIQYG